MNDSRQRKNLAKEELVQDALALDVVARDRRHVWHPFT
jgi:hypothetical protein